MKARALLHDWRASAPAARARDGWRAEVPYLALLLGAYALPLALVSPRGEFGLVDGWAYALAVRHLVDEGRLQISDWTATTLVFQVLWGAAFAKLFGFSFTVLRVSTLVLSFAGSAALYAIGRELAVIRPLALAGALAYWLNPLTFSLSYTFMSDVPAVSLIVLATLCAVRGVRRDSTGYLLLGSGCAALAFLVRHPGILLPPAVLAYGLLARWPARVLLRRGAAILVVPALAVAGYLLWSMHRGVPQEQARLLDLVLHTGPSLWQSALLLVGYLLLYLGATAVPLTLGFGRAILRAAGPGWHSSRLVLLAWALAVGGLVLCLVWRGGQLPTYPRWMPYLRYGTMFQIAGIGPDDLLGRRPLFIALPGRMALTVLAAGGLCGLGGALLLRLLAARRRPPGRPGPIVVVALLGLSQFAGLFPTTAHVLVSSWVSFDRYFLPLVPFAIVLGLWAVRGLRPSPALLLLGLLGLGLFSVVGTQDWLASNRLRWQLGRELLARGVPPERIDAGMEWDGWQLYERGRAFRAPPRTVDGPFWTQIIAPETDSTYVVAYSPLPGYVMRERRTYHSWLHGGPAYLYLLERP